MRSEDPELRVLLRANSHFLPLLLCMQGWGSSSNINQYPVHPVLGGWGPAGPVQYPILHSKRSPVQVLITSPYPEIYTCIDRVIKKKGSLFENYLCSDLKGNGIYLNQPPCSHEFMRCLSYNLFGGFWVWKLLKWVLGLKSRSWDWHFQSSTGWWRLDLQSVTGPKNARTGVDWRYCTAVTPHPCMYVSSCWYVVSQ